MRRSARALAVLVMLTAVAGCAARPPLPDEGVNPALAWADHQQRVAAISEWRMVGRIALIAEEGGGSATLQWYQRGEYYELSLLGPFGRGLANLRGTPDGATMETAEGEVLHAPDAQSLLYARFGWNVPVRPLRRWILGTAIAADAYRLDPMGRLASASSGEWNLQVRTYQRAGQLGLPRLLLLRNPRLKLKLVVDEWMLGPGSLGQSADRWSSERRTGQV